MSAFGVHRVQRDGAFHVAELAHVVLQAVDRGPAEQRVAHSLERLLVLDDALTLVCVPCGLTVHVARQDRATGLLELQEHHVVGRGSLEQRHIGPQADATHAHHLVGHVEQGVPAEHSPPVHWQRVQVVVERSGQFVGSPQRVAG